MQTSMRTWIGAGLTSLLLAAASAGAQSGAPGYTFKGGYSTGNTVQKTYDDADLNRAIQAYRFFYPTVSGMAIFKGSRAAGVVDNRTVPGKGWFVYFRVYGPEAAAFDGSWKPGDLEKVK